MDTLINDIYSLFEGHECDDALLDELATNLKSLLKERFRSYKSVRPSYLRISNIGKPCDRFLFYDVNGIEGEKLQPHTKLKFLYGDIIEALLIYLVKESGHCVTHEQEQVDIDGIKGHTDCMIDGRVCDVKSASTYSFKKFKDGVLHEQDSFGYIGQISGYDHAYEQGDGFFLVMDKQNGHLCTYEPPQEYRIDVPERIKHLKEVTSCNTPPERCFQAQPDGKSGNMKLGTECSYCSYKHECWKDSNNGMGLRTFLYSNGPRYLTNVERVPDVKEVQ